MIELLKGDCLEVMKGIESGSIDAIITDPPYGTTACKWDSVIDFKLMWEQLNRIIKPNGAIVLFGSEPFSSALRMSNVKNYKYDWVWNKVLGKNFLLAKKMPLKSHEIISVFYIKQPTYNPQRTEKKSEATLRREKRKMDCNDKSISEHYGRIKRVNSGSDYKYPVTIQTFKQQNKSNQFSKKSFHPTQKPVLLMEYLIKTYTNENETVLDFTMGSGSTMVAAKNTNRSGIGIEMDADYFKTASERVNYTESQKTIPFD